jgi:hypothetical protein
MAGERNLAVVVTANLKQMRDEMAKADAIIATTSGALNRMSNSYSGASTIANANAAMQSIRDIGGVTKLTDAEKKRLNQTMTEALEKYKVLGREAPAEMEKLRKETEQAAAQTEGFGARVTGLVAAGAAAKAAITGLVTIVGDWIASSSAQEDATVRLETALRAQGTYTPELAAQYMGLAGAFQQTTVFGDELVMEMQALLVQVGNVMPEQMDAALTAATDLAAGLRIDLKTATQLVGKAFAGETGTLKRYGIVIDEAKLKTEGASAVLDAIADKMGGQAQAQAQTFSGQMAQLGNVIGDVKEIIGQFIADAIAPMMRLFMDIPGPIRTGIVAFGLVATAAGALSVAIGGILAAGKLALPMLTTLLPAGAATTGGAFTLAAGAAKAFWLAVTGPFGLAVGVIAAITGAIIYFKDEIAELADKIGITKERAAGARSEFSRMGASIASIREESSAGRVQLSQYATAADEAAAAVYRQTVAQRLATEQAAEKARVDAELAAQQKAAEAEAKKLAEAFQKQVDVLTGKALAREVAELARQVEVAGRQGGITAHQMDLLGKKLSDLQKAGATLPPELARIAFEFSQAHIKGLPVITTSQSIAAALRAVTGAALGAAPSVAQLRLEMQGFARDYQQMSLPGVSLADNIKRYFAGVDAAAKGTGEKAAEAVASGFSNSVAAWASIGDTIVGAIMGGGSVGRAVGASIGGAIGKDIGAAIATSIGGTLGKAIGSFAGPLGAALGGAIGGAVSNLFGGNDTKKERERAAQVLGFSNADALYRELRSLGSEGAALANQALNLIGKKDVAANQQWIASVTNLLNKQSESLAKQQEAARELIPSWREAAALAEKYGITLEEIDAAVRQGELTELATTLYKDFERLAAFLGGEVNEGVLRGMSDEFSGLIGQALEFGLEIPNELRPVIERMREMGLLVDENGVAFSDAELDGLNFADTMEAATRDLITTMKELVEVLKNGVAGAINSVTGAVNGIPRSVDFDVRPNYGMPAPAYAGAFAEGGTVVANRPTFALFGEAGPERATFTPMGRGASSSGGGGGDQTIVVQVGEEVILRKVVRGMPRYLKLIGAQ